MTFKNITNCLSIIVLSLMFALPVMASTEHSESHEEEKFNVSEMIMHHIKDAHEWHLWGGHGNSTSIYLPIILVDEGLHVFSASHFYHGEHRSAVDSKTGEKVDYVAGVGPAAAYAMFHEKIYKMEHGELHFEEGHVHGAVKPLDLSLTRNVAFMLIASLILVLIMFSVAKYYRKNGAVSPKGIAKFIEPLIVFVRDDIAKEHINEHKYQRYLPYILTVFFFILICNLLGSVPLIGTNLTGNITVTMFLAVCTLLLTVLSGNKAYWKHIFWPPGVPIALMPIMIPLEIIGIFTKPFALMIRLFANITAGHIIVLALVSIIFINKNLGWAGLSVPMTLFISVLELLVAFLQAYLFALLSALFIGAAVEEHHH
ncbi:MAG: ATP synthase F0 subunit A [Bacteroidetes bacterium]|nr:MAG: ATP synthase F0 subunit A [Bacteroidota bacterium]